MTEEISYRGVKGQSYIIRGIGRHSCWYEYRHYLIGKIAVSTEKDMRIIGFSAEEKEHISNFLKDHHWSQDVELLQEDRIQCMSLIVDDLEDPDGNY